MFEGFSEETIRFFLDMRFNNNKAYFEENRSRYQSVVVEPFYALIEELTPVMQSIDPMMEVKPYRCLSRIYRDTRFSKDKSPFKDHAWITFKRAGEPKDQSVVFWFELRIDSVDWGMGFWGENRQALDTFRRRMTAQPERISDIIAQCNLPEHHLALDGAVWKRIEIPENIPKHLVRWYTAKSLYIGKVFAEQEWTFKPSLVKRLTEDYKALAPIYHMLRGMCEPAE